jgi:hypothetical protein
MDSLEDCAETVFRDPRCANEFNFGRKDARFDIYGFYCDAPCTPFDECTSVVVSTLPANQQGSLGEQSTYRVSEGTDAVGTALSIVGGVLFFGIVVALVRLHAVTKGRGRRRAREARENAQREARFELDHPITPAPPTYNAATEGQFPQAETSGPEKEAGAVEFTFCPKDGEQLGAGVNFCPKCGTERIPLAAYC